MNSCETRTSSLQVPTAAKAPWSWMVSATTVVHTARLCSATPNALNLRPAHTVGTSSGKATGSEENAPKTPR